MRFSGRIYEDVHLATDAEFRQVDSGLDRETRPGQDLPLFAGLQIIHVGAVAVCLLADGMSRAVAKVLPVSRLVDDLPGRIVHLPALEDLARLKSAAYTRDGRVSRLRHDPKNHFET